LLLQGPLGPFFDRLSGWLQHNGAQVKRVVFQGGDEHDCRNCDPIVFVQPPTQWMSFVRELLQAHDFDHVVVFGQARYYHAVAIRAAQELGVRVVVMEEGYFRPGFATMELDGVNGYSKTLARHEWHAHGESNSDSFLPLLGAIAPHDCEHHFRKMAWHASQHYIAIRQRNEKFPHYIHHKECNPYWYARYWVWSWLKKHWYRPGDLRVQTRLLASQQAYFLVALQHDGDSQITHHSNFNANTNFVIEVMRSFSLHAPKESLLVFRQHPHGRGGEGHVRLIRALSNECGIDGRVVHLIEGDTPLLVEKSRGVVLINSTVGLQALERNVPLIALGDAHYDLPGLTFQDGLDRFWTESVRPDSQASAAFCAQLKNLTQVPVSLYAMNDEPLTWR
jgi:capsular polysaccharide export protein